MSCLVISFGTTVGIPLRSRVKWDVPPSRMLADEEKGCLPPKFEGCAVLPTWSYIINIDARHELERGFPKAYIPELAEYISTLCMNTVRHFYPGAFLLRSEDPRYIHIIPCL